MRSVCLMPQYTYLLLGSLFVVEEQIYKGPFLRCQRKYCGFDLSILYSCIFFLRAFEFCLWTLVKMKTQIIVGY
jgi:hypothetical protein